MPNPTPFPASFTSQDFTPDKLLLEGQVISRKITIITGQNVVRGAVLGKITASGKYNLSLSAAVDGSQIPDAILAHDVDATAADKEALAYFICTVNETELTLGTAHTIASIKEGLRDKGIHLITPASGS